jgi:hypothetical protein
MAPNMKNASYSITGTVTVPDRGAEGMIVTQGGWFGGNALYLLKGKPVFAYASSHYPEQKYMVEAPTALAPGRHEVRVDFAYDGGQPGSGGTATIFVDNTKVADGRIAQTVPVRVSADETLRRRRRQRHARQPRLRRALPVHRAAGEGRRRNQTDIAPTVQGTRTARPGVLPASRSSKARRLPRPHRKVRCEIDATWRWAGHRDLPSIANDFGPPSARPPGPPVHTDRRKPGPGKPVH